MAVSLPSGAREYAHPFVVDAMQTHGVSSSHERLYEINNICLELGISSPDDARFDAAKFDEKFQSVRKWTREVTPKLSQQKQLQDYADTIMIIGMYYRKGQEAKNIECKVYDENRNQF